jgi:hypothetical protein
MPWRPGISLPFGSVLPTWVDAIVMGVLLLLALELGAVAAPVTIFIAAAAPYSLGFVPALSAAGLHRHVYAMAGLLGVAVLVWPSVWGVLAVALVGLAVGVHGAKRSLDALRQGAEWKPDSELGLGAMFLQNVLKGIGHAEPTPLGWPYGGLSPRDPGPRLSRERAVLIPLVIGWLMFVFLSLDEEPEPLAPGTGLLLGFGAGVVRLLIYAWVRHWPVSPWARVRLGVLIVPRYDVVFIGPLAAAGAAALVWWVLRVAGAPIAVVIAAPFVVALWIVLLCPPTQGRWELTGAHRMVA